MLNFEQKAYQLYFENIIKHIPAHVYWKASDGCYLYCNDSQAKSAGLSRYEFIGKTDFDLPWKTDADTIRQNDIEIMQSGISHTFEETSVLANGSERLFLSHKTPLRDSDNQIIGIMGISFDITEQKQLENALKANKARTEAVLDNVIANLPGHVYWKDKNGVFLGCNEQQAQSAGFQSRKEMLGKTDFNMPWKEQANMLRSIDQEVIRTAIHVTAEEPSILADGREAIFLSKKVPLYQDKEIIGVLGISFDITEQRRVEKELLETHHKLEGMTLVSASIAHEIRTPLSTLEVSADIIEDNIPPLIDAYNEALKANITVPEIDKSTFLALTELPHIMKRETQGANTFINMLLMNVNPELDGSPSQSFFCSAGISEALERYPFKPGQQELVIWNDSHDFLVKGKQKLVVHILFNLLKNALFYLAHAGKGQIEIELQPGEFFNKLSFTDTGSGIPADILPHIFERFFSRTRNGSGIGLTYCKMVMDALGGSITCESVVGDYTKFILSFPCVLR